MGAMELEGLDHITMVAGDARATVAFHADLLGLRLVTKTVNFDSPDAYHRPTPLTNPRAGQRV